MARFLADTTIWAWAAKQNRLDIREKLSQRFMQDRIVTCSPVVLEALHKPDSPAKYEAAYIDYFDPLDWLPLDTAAAERAVEVQREMAQASTGNHRRGAVDFLIAAVAEVAGPEYVLWHFDRDLRLICQHTGQAQEAEDSTGPGR